MQGIWLVCPETLHLYSSMKPILDLSCTKVIYHCLIRSVHFFDEEKTNQKTHHKIPRYCSVGVSNQSIAYPLWVVLPEYVAGIFWTLRLLAEKELIPPAYGFVSRPGQTQCRR